MPLEGQKVMMRSVMIWTVLPQLICPLGFAREARKAPWTRRMWMGHILDQMERNTHPWFSVFQAGRGPSKHPRKTWRQEERTKEEDFEGDTAITLPGVGQVNVTRNGDNARFSRPPAVVLSL